MDVEDDNVVENMFNDKVCHRRCHVAMVSAHMTMTMMMMMIVMTAIMIA